MLGRLRPYIYICILYIYIPDDLTMHVCRGGSFRFASFNAGPLQSKWAMLLTLGVHVFGLQEVTTPKATWPFLSKMLRDVGATVVHGDERELRTPGKEVPMKVYASVVESQSWLYHRGGCMMPITCGESIPRPNASVIACARQLLCLVMCI